MLISIRQRDIFYIREENEINKRPTDHNSSIGS